MKFRLILSSFVVFLQLNSNCYLFQKFPGLESSIPYVRLCDLPTPIMRLESFGEYLQHPALYIKRDDLTGKNVGNDMHLYGGNKPRKLEFLLADAKQKKKKTIVTYGCAGSNHALATAVYAHVLGFKSILMLKNQPNSYIVRHNLLLDNYYDAQLQFFPNNQERSAAAARLLQDDDQAYLIPTGGSNEIGVLGFVNAALELADQIKSGEMPEPDLLYVATGSCATTAGLLLGIKLAGLKTKVVAVCVEPEDEEDEFLNNIKALFAKTAHNLHALDAHIPLFEFSQVDLILNKKYCGTAYGLFIPDAQEAGKIFKDKENIALEGTYSAKPIAAVIDDAAAGMLAGKTVLFWNTYCGIDFSHVTVRAAYKKLPQEFHKYFEQDVQPLAKL